MMGMIAMLDDSQARVRPLVEGLESWMRAERSKLSSGSAAAKAMDYMVKRWTTFSAFLDDGRICLTNNAAERALRGIDVGRRNWTFAGSDAERPALPDRVRKAQRRRWLARINDHPAKAIGPLALELESRKSGRHVWTFPRRQGFFGLVPVAVMYTSFAGPWRFAACPGS